MSSSDKDVVAEYLRSVPDVTSMTVNQVRGAVEQQSGRSVDKAVVREAIQEFLEAQATSAAAGNASPQEADMDVVADSDSGASDEQEEGDEDGFDDFAPEWRARFHDVVWARTSPSYPWYAYRSAVFACLPRCIRSFHAACIRFPAIICNPNRIDAKIADRAKSCVGKKHTIYYYADYRFDFATPSQMKDFNAHKAEFLEAVTKMKKHQASVEAAAEEASRDAALDPSARVSSLMHSGPRRRGRKPGKQAKKPETNTPRKSKQTGSGTSKTPNEPSRGTGSVSTASKGFKIPTPRSVGDVDLAKLGDDEGLGENASAAISAPHVVVTKTPKPKAAAESATAEPTATGASGDRKSKLSKAAAVPKEDEEDEEAEFDFDDEGSSSSSASSYGSSTSGGKRGRSEKGKKTSKKRKNKEDKEEKEKSNKKMRPEKVWLLHNSMIPFPSLMNLPYMHYHLCTL